MARNKAGTEVIAATGINVEQPPAWAAGLKSRPGDASQGVWLIRVFGCRSASWSQVQLQVPIPDSVLLGDLQRSFSLLLAPCHASFASLFIQNLTLLPCPSATPPSFLLSLHFSCLPLLLH